MTGLVIPSVLTAAEVNAIRETLPEVTFADGRNTAGQTAASKKANSQASPSPERDAILQKAAKALTSNQTFQAAALPQQMTPLILSRYRVGQTYGTHVDNALMGTVRTDISFTLFLSDPDSYDGGALEITGPSDTRAIKLSAGDLYLYPSTALHRVTPVERGQRLAVVGWVQSWVRSAEEREMLFDLGRAMAQVEHGGAHDLLAKLHSNLLRRWAGR